MTGPSRQGQSILQRGVRIAGTGVSVPDRVLSNEDLAKLVDTNDEWITTRTGIKTRHVVENGQSTKDLAREATEQALADAGMKPTDLDMVICATMTPEMCMPSTAVRLAYELGATPAGGFDVSAACSGFVYAMNVASSLITAGAAKTVAVIGSETLSKIVNYKDRNTCILFGDGAGAAILTASEDVEQGSLYSSMNSNGEGWELLYCPRNEHDLPSDPHAFTGEMNTMQMNGREVFKFAVTTLENTIDKALKSAGIEAKDLAMIVPHQSNVRILRTARDRLDLPEDKMWINIERYGNTSAASVPICLHEIREQGKVKKGDLVLFVALGGGLTWASSLWRL